MRLRYLLCTKFLVSALSIVVSVCEGAPVEVPSKAKLTVFEATLEAELRTTPELSTNEFKAFLAKRGVVVFDAQADREFAAAHVPGSISIEETGFLRLVQAYPDRSTEIVVYANGPFADSARRRADELVNLGYTKVRRYQLGLAVWRALGNTAETTLQGFRRMFSENSAVMIDARSRAEFAAGTIPAAESIQPGEAGQATRDPRLQYYDRNTRIVVFGNSSDAARRVAEEIARQAYPNSSYFGGTYLELKQAKFFSERKPSASTLRGLKH
ncbi:MAG: hypothetical protein A3G25_00720 [Betaproteobacteria bacterium RIFCSPLOWO2_12_FULL_63_13]|nr:MAG: hypothetical protein A3G25_00720 [Betaproteobacteria bacterium RIFCSPLOWO2_12_FULL_63_13]